MSDKPEPTKPEWLANWTPVPTRWQPGQSGNPRGRRPGEKAERTLVAEALRAGSEDVAKTVLAKALTGDMGAAKLVLERIHPPLRNEGPRVQFTLDKNAPLAEQGQQVIYAVSLGQMDVDTGKILIECLCSFAKLRETDELAKRLDALEQQALAAATAGHVLGRVMQTASEAAP